MYMEKTPWEKAVEFHGHVCPGLTMGFRAAEEALRRLGVSLAGDEELIAIVENEACGVDRDDQIVCPQCAEEYRAPVTRLL